MFYNCFYEMEDELLLNVEDDIHVLSTSCVPSKD